MNEKPRKKAKCRGCGTELRGDAGRAYNPRNNEECKVNHYGGFVCSAACDYRASLELERSMPGSDSEQKELRCYSQKSFNKNWDTDET